MQLFQFYWRDSGVKAFRLADTSVSSGIRSDATAASNNNKFTEWHCKMADNTQQSMNSIPILLKCLNHSDLLFDISNLQTYLYIHAANCKIK